MWLVLAALAMPASAEPEVEIDPAVRTRLEKLLQPSGHLSFSADSRLDNPGFQRGLAATDEAGTSWTLTLTPGGGLASLIADSAITHCGERHRRWDEPPLKAESDPAQIQAGAIKFLDQVTSSTVELAASTCVFNGQDNWALLWHRQEGGIPYEEDFLSLDVCDRSHEVLLYIDGFHSAPPASRPSAVDAPMAEVPPDAINKVLDTLNACSEECSGGGCTTIKFSPGHWAIVNPNGLFESKSIEDLPVGPDKSRNRPSAYARVYRYIATHPRRRYQPIGDLWVGADDKILGGVILTH